MMRYLVLQEDLRGPSLSIHSGGRFSADAERVLKKRHQIAILSAI